jgi:polysaccharide export outer membrane protein
MPTSLNGAMMFGLIPRALMVSVILVVCVACTTVVDPNYYKLLEPSSSEAPPSANTIGPTDKVSIRVYREDELGGEFVISPDGTISFPLVGKLSVAGATCSDIEDRLEERLGNDFLKNPSVSCSVLEFNSKKISVFGEVNKPGNFSYEDRMSVVQAITSAGGFKDTAAKNNTTLVRVMRGRKVRVRVPVSAIVEGEIENLALMPGDIIFVPRALM